MALLQKLVEPELLEQHLTNQSLLIVDLCNEQLYQQSHIPGAVHVSPAELMCGVPPAPGRLPETAQLNRLFSRIGLTADSHVVVYDDEGGGWAGRLIWTLEIIGHHNWSYLNGGMVAWKAEGHPLTAEVNQPLTTDYQAQIDSTPIAEIPDIMQGIEPQSIVVWDARSADEYHGQRVLAQKGGHIPGAIHCEWTELMDPSKNLRIREDALEYLSSKGIHPDKPIITHCQSHHRSGFTYLVGTLLGFENIKGYHGSWSEWGNHPDTPVEIN